jgi:hypothetical protein
MKGEERLTIFQQARCAADTVRLAKAAYDPDEEEGILPGGQACGGIYDIVLCRELIERTVAKAERMLQATVGNAF